MLGIFEIEDALATVGYAALASLTGLVFALVIALRWVRHL